MEILSNRNGGGNIYVEFFFTGTNTWFNFISCCRLRTRHWYYVCSKVIWSKQAELGVIQMLKRIGLLTLLLMFIFGASCWATEKPLGNITSEKDIIDKVFSGRTLDL